jgi:hypothetical protein
MNCAPASISDTEDWLTWNGDFDNPNDGEDDCSLDVQADMDQDNRIEDPESPAQWDVRSAQNVPRLIRPTRKSKRHAEKVFVMVDAIETRSSNRVKKSRTEWVNVSPASLCILTEIFS